MASYAVKKLKIEAPELEGESKKAKNVRKQLVNLDGLTDDGGKQLLVEGSSLTQVIDILNSGGVAFKILRGDQDKKTATGSYSSVQEQSKRLSAIGKRHFINTSKLNFPADSIDCKLSSEKRWWKPGSKLELDLSDIDIDFELPHKNFSLKERKIRLMNNQEVTFVKRVEADTSSLIPRKRFFLKDSKVQVIKAGDIDAQLFPLYGEDRLRDGEPVVLCEGIDATDALLELKINALGTLTGALTIPSLNALSILKGRKVVLWPDNDDVGVSHMAKIHEVLSGWGIECSIVRWIDGPHKGDAADYVKLHGSAEALINKAEEWDTELLYLTRQPADIEVPTSPPSLIKQ